ncbi:MAG: dipeptide epimerase [Acidobacteria bacterium]|nr:dipeptide epimerase [Acidobacteriota bacterium]
MTRRDCLALGLLPAGAADAAPPRVSISARSMRLDLVNTWTTVMSSSDYRETLAVRVTGGGIMGIGEGAPIVRYNESAAEGVKIVEGLQSTFAGVDLAQYAKVLDQLFAKVPGAWATKAAIDIALHDWAAKRLGVPLWKMWGLDANDAPQTTFSIGIDKAEVIRRKVREAAAYPVLKIKVGLANDEEVIDAVRAETKKPLRVDANEGWKTVDEAVRKIKWLETQGVEFIEQPMPAAMLTETGEVRKRVNIPIFADECCLHPEDIPRIAPYFDGINVKVDKAGGLRQAMRMIEMARALQLKVMVGCMVSSSLAITAAAQLSPLIDYADLDGNLLIKNDPFDGVKVVNGKLVLPARPGVGVIDRPGAPR